MSIPVVQIVGIGSPFGADAFAWQLIAHLQETGFAQRYPSVRLRLACCASPAQLPGRLADTASLVVLDALHGAGLGELRCVHGRQMAQTASATSSHGLDLVAAVELVEQHR